MHSPRKGHNVDPQRRFHITVCGSSRTAMCRLVSRWAGPRRGRSGKLIDARWVDLTDTRLPLVAGERTIVFHGRMVLSRGGGSALVFAGSSALGLPLCMRWPAAWLAKGIETDAVGGGPASAYRERPGAIVGRRPWGFDHPDGRHRQQNTGTEPPVRPGPRLRFPPLQPSGRPIVAGRRRRRRAARQGAHGRGQRACGRWPTRAAAVSETSLPRARPW